MLRHCSTLAQPGTALGLCMHTSKAGHGLAAERRARALQRLPKATGTELHRPRAPACCLLPAPRTLLLSEAEVKTATPQTPSPFPTLCASPGSAGQPQDARRAAAGRSRPRAKQTPADPGSPCEHQHRAKGLRRGTRAELRAAVPLPASAGSLPWGAASPKEPEAPRCFARLLLLGWELVGIPSGYTGVNPEPAGNRKGTIPCCQVVLSRGRATNTGG